MARKTLSWKHNRKDRKQYIHDGKVWIDNWYMIPFVRYDKHDTPFMHEDMDPELMV